MLYIVSTTPTFSFFTSGLGCGEEWAGYQRDEEIHKQKYFLFVGFIEQFKKIWWYGNSIYSFKLNFNTSSQLLSQQ